MNKQGHGFSVPEKGRMETLRKIFEADMEPMIICKGDMALESLPLKVDPETQPRLCKPLFVHDGI